MKKTIPPFISYEAGRVTNRKRIEMRYASYKSKCWFNEKENSIYSVSTLILKHHKIPASDFAQLKTFFDNVMQDDSQKIVIVKTEGEKTEKKVF